MGIENIATGYKPEFALGALYHGFNAGSADNASQLSNLIQEQALQKSRIGDPLDLIKKQYEAMVANAQMNNPDYIPAHMQGDMGRFASSAAKGKIDSSSVDEQIKALLAELAQKTGKSNLLNQFQNQQQYDINAIGTQQPEQPQMAAPQPEYQSPVNPNYGNEGRGLTPLPILKNEAAMKASMGNDYRFGDRQYDLETLDKEIRLHGDKTGQLAKERERLIASLAGGQSTGEQAAPLQTQAPQSSAPLGSKLRQMAKILGTTPEHLNRMEEIKAQNDARLEMANIAANARLQAVHDAQQKGDTTKVAELNLAAKNDAEAGRYEALINKQDIARQEREILEKIVDKTKQKAAMAELNATVKRYEQLAKAYRDQAGVIYKKHGLAVPTATDLVPAPVQPQQGVIKLD